MADENATQWPELQPQAEQALCGVCLSQVVFMCRENEELVSRTESAVPRGFKTCMVVDAWSTAALNPDRPSANLAGHMGAISSKSRGRHIKLMAPVSLYFPSTTSNEREIPSFKGKDDPGASAEA